MKQYYVLGFLFSEDKSKVALIKKLKPDWQKGLLNGIGGKIEEIDYPKDINPILKSFFKEDLASFNAIKREFKEETGVEIKDWNYFCELENKEWCVYCYCSFNDQIYNVTTIEDEEVFIVKVDELSNYDIISNIKWLVYLALDKNRPNVIANY